VPASPNRGGVREMRTPTNTPCGLPPQAGTQEDEDASLAAAMEASAMEFAIQASLREGARAEPAAAASPATPHPPRGRPGMTPAAGVGPVSSGMGPSPGAKMLEEGDSYHSPFCLGDIDSASDEATDRAIALALAEEDCGPAEHATPDRHQQILGDEEVARRLQRELDAEAAGVGLSPPSIGSRPPSAIPPADTPFRASPQSTCAGCNRPLAAGLGALLQPGGGRYLQAMGKRWHPACFCCAGCTRPISDAAFAVRDGAAYHSACHRKRFHPWCSVCQSYIPAQPDKHIRFSENPFWKTKYCPEHLSDGTPRCYSCNRMQARGEEYVALQDGRHSCLTCVDSIVVDTADCQPLYQDVLYFFESLSMPLPVRPPLMLVESSALNDAEDKEGIAHRQGPVFHTRGLCLSEIHHRVTTVRRAAPGGLRWLVVPEEVHIPSTTARVTAILVLFGMPRLLTGSIIAHELMHAWLKLSGLPADMQLLPMVEEGLCQLMAHLWLGAQQPHMMAMQACGCPYLHVPPSHPFNIYHSCHVASSYFSRVCLFPSLDACWDMECQSLVLTRQHCMLLGLAGARDGGAGALLRAPDRDGPLTSLRRRLPRLPTGVRKVWPASGALARPDDRVPA